MKKNQINSLTTNLALAATLAVLAGCVSKSYDKGAATSDALHASATAVADTSSKVTDVLGALNQLTFKSEGDLRKQYDAYVDSIKNLESSATTLDSKVADMRAAAADYSQNWSNQLATISNEDLRARSTDRMTEVTTQLKGMNEKYVAVKNNLTPFISDARDIQTYLGTDLTVAGIGTIKDSVAKTKADAVPLRDSIKQLQASFDDLSATLSPVMPTPPAAATQ